MRIEQTIIDLARRLSEADLFTLTDDAIAANVLAAERLAGRYAVVARSRPAGLAKVRRLLDAFGDGYVPPASELERLLYATLDWPGMPPYERQASAPWRSPKDERVDALIPSSNLIIEADGRRWHTRVRDFDNDRRRDNAAAAHGYLVQRYGWEMLRHEPDDVARSILAATSHGRSRTYQVQDLP
ncbi:MAG: DUF559 domain-containing protein [Actinobacteria bacterium]|nr:DUF559 domain-containing protein [Actinomycetota bacterium]